VQPHTCDAARVSQKTKGPDASSAHRLNDERLAGVHTTSVVTPSAILASSHAANAADSMTFEPCFDTHGISDSAAARFAGGSESGLWRKKRVASEGRLESALVA
jgi:hypothetical protein